MHAALPLTALVLWFSATAPATDTPPRHLRHTHKAARHRGVAKTPAPSVAAPSAPGPSSTPASSGPPQLAVLEPSAPVSLTAMSGQVAQWVASEARSQGLNVWGPDEVAQALGDEAYAQLQSCRGQPACVRGFASKLHVPRLVVGTLDKDEQSYTVHLLLLEPGGRRLASLDRVVRIATRQLGAEVRTGTAAFLKGQTAKSGVLKLVADAVGAAVTLDGAAAGLTPLSVSLSPGRHEVEVEKGGRLPVHRWVTVSAGQTTTEEVKLLVIPGTESAAMPTLAGADAPTMPSATSGSPPPLSAGSADGGGYRVPVGTWVAGGVAVALLDVGLYFGITSGKVENSLRAGYDPATQHYAGTRALALAGRRDAIAADALFAAAGAAALSAAGIALFAPQAPAHVQLSATSQSASVAVGGAF